MTYWYWFWGFIVNLKIREHKEEKPQSLLAVGGLTFVCGSSPPATTAAMIIGSVVCLLSSIFDNKNNNKNEIILN